MRYRVFRRSWWRENKDGTWPDGLEPCPGDRRYVRGGMFDTEEEAREYCHRLNDPAKLTYRERRLGYKFEYEGS